MRNAIFSKQEYWISSRMILTPSLKNFYSFVNKVNLNANDLLLTQKCITLCGFTVYVSVSVLCQFALWTEPGAVVEDLEIFLGFTRISQVLLLED
jgi:hypothetical protein